VKKEKRFGITIQEKETQINTEQIHDESAATA
jgi:hypothetical protein